MADFINTVDVIGDATLTDSIIDRSVTEYADDKVTKIGTKAFVSCSNLTSVNCPSATEVKTEAFMKCTALTKVDFPAATAIGGSAFSSCSSLTTANCPVAKTILTEAFYKCSTLTTADFSVATSIGQYAFGSCTQLTAFILRSETMAKLNATNAFNATPIASGTGYIYVPAALVDSYKAATNWSTYANQFRAIEDYPEVCDPYSWDAVFKNIDNGTYKDVYKVGDTIPLDLGSEGVINMQIAAFDADTLADGTGTAAISWVGKELLATDRRMKSGNSNVGGWAEMTLRNTDLRSVYALIPAGVRGKIEIVNKKYDVGGRSTDIATVADDVWIPSLTEVGAESASYSAIGQGVVYPLFTDNASRSKGNYWWLRSAYNGSSMRFNYIKTDGSVDEASGNTGNRFGVCLGFCTGKSK